METPWPLPTSRKELARHMAAHQSPWELATQHPASSRRRRRRQLWVLEPRLGDTSSGREDSTRTAQLAAVSGHHTRDRLHRLADLPTLIIQPTDDLLVRPAESERLLGLIPNATLLRLDATGHGLIRQRPREINLALLEHFTDAEAGARVR